MRNKMFALDFATQLQQMKAIGGQLASYSWGAATVIFVVGAQKLVPMLAAAHERIYTHSLPLHSELPGGSTSSSSASRPATEPPGQPDPPRQEMAL